VRGRGWPEDSSHESKKAGMTQNILDIDLDFFQSGRITDNVHSEERPRSEKIKPWNKDRTITFLEQNCGLDKVHKPPGKQFTDHHEVFWEWQKLIAEKKITPPFNIVHIDAHADLGLGMGDTSWAYIMGELLHKPVCERTDIKIGGWDGLKCGNYLSFAIANRWVSKLSFVINENWQDDIPRCFLRDTNVPDPLTYGQWCFTIALRQYTQEQIRDISMRVSEPEPLAYEPPVSFEIIPYQQFKNTAQFDYMFVCKSPEYTCWEADKLLLIIKNYVTEY